MERARQLDSRNFWRRVISAWYIYIDWTRYRELIGQREAESLTQQEYSELIVMADEVETANVVRIELLVKLAALRHTTLPALMNELGMKPVDIE